MARRAAAIAQQRKLDPDLLLLSTGDFYAKPGILEMYQSRFIASTMISLGYTAVAVGERELGYGLRAIQADADAGLPVICANVYRGGERLFPPSVREKVGGKKVGIFALIGESPEEPGDLEIRDPAAEGARAIDEMREAGCDIVVLLAHMGKDKLASVLADLQGVDVVIRGHVTRDTPVSDDCADTLGGEFEDLGVPVLYGGDRGRSIGRVRVVHDGDGIELVERGVIYCDRSVGEDPEIAAAVKTFYGEQGVRRRKLQLSEFVIRDEVTGKIKERYLGLNTCRRCHNNLMSRFVLSRHFRAFETLYHRDENENPTCLICHTTGYGEFSGYDPAKEKKGDIYLRGVQCEACHGPGTRHSRDGRYVESARTSCRRCHTPAWSPGFDYEKYWAEAGHCTPADSSVHGTGH